MTSNAHLHKARGPIDQAPGEKPVIDPVPEKKPRRRAFAPKVRTGCLTCKIRRKKCDEEKPFCRRCIRTDVVCDGYPDLTKTSKAIVPKSSKSTAPEVTTASKDAAPATTGFPAMPHRSRSNSRSSTSSDALILMHAQKASPYGISVLDSAADPDLLASHESSRMFFHHFRTVVIADLIRVVDANDFWVAHVLPLCYTEPAVLHAITALGAAHTSYLSNRPTSRRSSPSESSTDESSIASSGHEWTATQHYNYSIRQILNSFESKDKPDVDRVSTLLVCCIVFYCLECLQGRPDDAMKHLRSGASLLGGVELSPYRLIGPDNYDRRSLPPLLCSAATVLDRLGIDASFLLEETVVPTAAAFLGQDRSYLAPAVPFSSMQEAKDAMWTLDTRMFRLMMDEEGECDEEEEDCVFSFAECDEPEWKLLHRDFRCWSAKFATSFGPSIRMGEAPSNALRERLILTLRQRLWDIFFFTNKNNLPIIYEAAVCTVEHVYEIEEALGHRSVFTLDCDTIPLLVMIASDSESHLPRVVRLLRQYHRRECLWDSFVVADKLEAAPPGTLMKTDWRVFWM